MAPSHSPKQNRILAALPPADYARLLPHLELVCIPSGEGIYEPGIHITHLYFPIDCIVAWIGELASGAAFQTAIAGNEGMAGLSYLLGCENAHARAVVLSGGSAFRIKASLLKKEFESGGALQRLLLRFARALMVQTTLLAVSARHYSIEQQLCHFLLMCLDRLPGNELSITQQQLSIFLGSRRESITVAAQKLEATCAIHSRRGHLTVVNRQELELLAGESDGVVCKEYQYLQEYEVPSNAIRTCFS
jgi:CRP-like cAMP-binding protein